MGYVARPCGRVSFQNVARAAACVHASRVISIAPAHESLGSLVGLVFRGVAALPPSS